MSSSLDAVQPGAIVGPYRIMRGFRGHGGMAQIFEVEVREKYRQPGMPRRLALKVAKPEHQAALVAEADYLRMFDHPNVVRIFPLPGFHKPVYSARAEFPFGLGWYYAMEMLDGGSLEWTLTHTTTVTDLLRVSRQRQRRLNVYVALGVVRQIADALAHIHERHIVNLDVKPANILFRRRRFSYFRGSVPHAILGDFGIARDLRYPRAGLLGVATPEYVSPEHASELNGRLARVDCRSDIFSLGIVLYEMLTGEMPFANVALILDPRYVPARPRELRSSISDTLDEMIMVALEKDPNRRFQTVRAMRAALDRVPTPVDWPRMRRIFAGIAIAGGLMGGGMWLRSHDLTSPGPAPTPTLEPTSAPTATDTPPPTVVDNTPAPQQNQSAPTSTPRPTPTPIPTRIPVTATPAPTEQP